MPVAPRGRSPTTPDRALPPAMVRNGKGAASIADACVIACAKSATEWKVLRRGSRIGWARDFTKYGNVSGMNVGVMGEKRNKTDRRSVQKGLSLPIAIERKITDYLKGIHLCSA